MSDDNTAEDLKNGEGTEAMEDANLLVAADPMKGLRKAAIAVMALGGLALAQAGRFRSHRFRYRM